MVSNQSQSTVTSFKIHQTSVTHSNEQKQRRLCIENQSGVKRYPLFYLKRQRHDISSADERKITICQLRDAFSRYKGRDIYLFIFFLSFKIYSPPQNMISTIYTKGINSNNTTNTAVHLSIAA